MALVIENLSKKFDNSNQHTLKEINLTIENGEFVCIVGQSGCGKSTLLNLVAGLEKPTTGKILLNDKPIFEPGADRTVMFQEHGLFPWLNVIDNVTFGLKLNNVPKGVQLEKADYYLKMVHLDNYKDYAIHQLSGGMRQRVALARALTMDSDILLMDEPFSALDKQTSNRLREELEQIWLQTGKTILFITHSVEEAVYLADKVIILSPVTKQIVETVNINLPRPRDIYDTDFINYRHHILNQVRGTDETY